LLRSDIEVQLSTFSMVLEQQRKELSGKEFPLSHSDLQACILQASSHVARLERLHRKWTQMQAVQGISTQQVQKVVRDAVLPCSQILMPSQKLGALPESSEPSTWASSPGRASWHPSASDMGVGQISQTPGKGSWHYVHSLGNGVARKPGIVNSRIQHFEGRIQEVVDRASLLDEMQQIASLDTHLPPLEDFDTLQQTAQSSCGESQISTATSTSHVAARSLPWPSHAASMDQRRDVSSKTLSREVAQPKPVSSSFTLAAKTVPSRVLSF